MFAIHALVSKNKLKESVITSDDIAKAIYSQMYKHQSYSFCHLCTTKKIATRFIAKNSLSVVDGFLHLFSGTPVTTACSLHDTHKPKKLKSFCWKMHILKITYLFQT